MGLRELGIMAKRREAAWAAVPGITESWATATEQQRPAEQDAVRLPCSIFVSTLNVKI